MQKDGAFTWTALHSPWGFLGRGCLQELCNSVVRTPETRHLQWNFTSRRMVSVSHTDVCHSGEIVCHHTPVWGSGLSKCTGALGNQLDGSFNSCGGGDLRFTPNFQCSERRKGSGSRKVACPACLPGGSLHGVHWALTCPPRSLTSLCRGAHRPIGKLKPRSY